MQVSVSTCKTHTNKIMYHIRNLEVQSGMGPPGDGLSSIAVLVHLGTQKSVEAESEGTSRLRPISMDLMHR